MLPAAARLRRRPEFATAIRHGDRVGRPPVVIHAVASEPADEVRVGFVVNRAVGPAVIRNRVRRRLRHLVAARLPQLREELPGHLIVVRAAPAAAVARSTELGRALDAAFTAVVARSGRQGGP